MYLQKMDMLTMVIQIMINKTGLFYNFEVLMTVREEIVKPRSSVPVVQSIISLTSSLVVKMLNVLVSTISNSQLFLLKNVSSFCKCKSYSHFFSKNSSVYVIFNYQSFNDTLTNNIISFEHLGLDFCQRTTEPQCEKKYHLICVSNKDSNQPV